MGTNYLLLTSLSQWGLFLGIGLICYAGIEKKFNLLMAGQSVFIALSLFALWILLSHQIVVPEFTGDQLPKEARTVSYFVTLSGVGLFALAGLIMHLLKTRFQLVINALLVLYALALFFMVYNLQRIAS
jgi:hypothetical protein